MYMIALSIILSSIVTPLLGDMGIGARLLVYLTCVFIAWTVCSYFSPPKKTAPPTVPTPSTDVNDNDE